MQHIHIISVGKQNSEFHPLILKYQKMIKAIIKFTEISYSKKLPDNLITFYEAQKILEYVDSKSFKIALDVRGKILSSNQFSDLINNHSKISFIIGGAFGLDKSILEMMNFKVSLSQLTFPHAMAKLILIEQIFRAQTIIAGHPYHK